MRGKRQEKMFVNGDVHKKGKGLIFLALAKSF
jgi:hypothetical protein